MKLDLVDGPSERFDVWWRGRFFNWLSCPKCGFIQSARGKVPELLCVQCRRISAVEMMGGEPPPPNKEHANA